MCLEWRATWARGAFERITAATLLIAVLPLIFLLCAGLTSLGQRPIFRQTRIGYAGTVFTIQKFRTVPEQGWPQWSETAGSYRNLWFHRLSVFLRKTGLDELPQLWNIVRGEMRFIGPRPLTPEDYAALPCFRDLRCRVHPGITGLAQVNGGQALDPDAKLVLDLYLIDRSSLVLHIDIIARSIARLVGLSQFVSIPNKALLERAQSSARSRIDASALTEATGAASRVSVSPHRGGGGMRTYAERSRPDDHIINALSFDLEDWFHMVGVNGLDNTVSWRHFPSIFERYTRLVLDDLGEFGVHATFFVLGWIAERYPDTIREIAARGHEIGSHSHLHRTVYELGPSAFGEDLRRSICAIQAACGRVPRGFRAPSFSIIPGCEWAFDALLDAGFDYDASLFPGTRAHGGYPCLSQPHRLNAPSGRTIEELPMSTMCIAGRRIAFSGGGYMRLLPLRAITKGFTQSHAEARPVVVYLHPSDFATDCPSPPMALHRRLKSRIGRHTTRSKLRFLLATYRFGTCRSVLDRCLAGASQGSRHIAAASPRAVTASG